MTMAPIARNASAIAISAVLWRNAARPPPPADIPQLPSGRLLLPCDEARRPHERDVARFLARHPLGVLLAGERGLVECAALHQVLPFRSRAHFLEQVDV